MTIERAEPTFSNDEVGMLRSFLDHYRATIRLQASGLTAAQLEQPLPPSDLTLGGMLKHLAFVEDYWFSYHLLGHDPAPPWDSAPWSDDPDWDWHSAAGTPHAELDALLAAAIARSDECLDAALAADPDLSRPVARTRPPEKGETASVRWVLVHLVEEYCRHAGHADLIRQSIDGATDV
jgi:uncharacterized damage-inducible protein DinB